MIPVSAVLVCVGVICATFGFWKFNSIISALTRSKPGNQPEQVSDKDSVKLARQCRTILLFSGIVFGMGIVPILQQLAP